MGGTGQRENIAISGPRLAACAAMPRGFTLMRGQGNAKIEPGVGRDDGLTTDFSAISASSANLFPIDSHVTPGNNSYMRWLFFSYTLPSRPSRARVSVWRQLKKLGAVNYQSVWVLPFSGERVNEVKKLIQDIQNWNGEGLLIDGKVLNQVQEESISKAFVESRDEEYREIIGKCEDYAKEIEFEIGRQNFIFAEVEENEEELEKLKQWLKKVEKRDIVDAPLHKEAFEKIEACETLFQDFALMVYKHSQIKDQKRRRAAKKGQPESQE